MRIYIAARYDRRFEMLGVSVDLMRAGHEVTSRWIDSGREDPPALLATASRIGDLARADCLVTFTDQPDQAAAGSAGRRIEIEFGVALATGKRLCVVGTRDEVLHYLPRVEVYATTADLIAGLARPPKVAT